MKNNFIKLIENILNTSKGSNVICFHDYVTGNRTFTTVHEIRANRERYIITMIEADGEGGDISWLHPKEHLEMIDFHLRGWKDGCYFMGERS